MKKILLWLSLLAFPLMGTELVLDDLTIILPENPISAEKTAASELSEHLEKICGKKFTIKEAKNAPVRGIFLVADEKMAPESYKIWNDDNKLIIKGGRPRGVLYGVYHFLEEQLNVKWYTPYFTKIDKTDSIKVKNVNISGAPAMPYRSIYERPFPNENSLKFYVRNRLNVEKAEYGGQILFGGSVNCHTLYSTFGKEKIIELFKTHPEYFPLINGERKFDAARPHGGASTQLCLSNQGLRKAFVDAMREWIKKDAVKAKQKNLQPPMFYAIDQNDTYDGFCECVDCLAIITQYGGVKSALLLDFTNYVAEALKADAPQATFLMMAIHSTEKPPKNLKVADNVGIRLADTTSNMTQSWEAPDNKNQRNNLEAWSKICDKISIWDYSINFGALINQDLPLPNLRTFAPDIRFAKAHNGIGFFTEHEQVMTSDLRDLKIYTEIKLYENPNLDENALIEDFVYGFYGKKSGKFILDYLQLLNESADKAKSSILWFPRITDFSYLNAEFILKGMKYFDNAVKAAGDDAELVSRIQHAGMSLDRAFLMKYTTLLKTVKKTDLPDYEAVKKRYFEIWQNNLKKFKCAYDDKLLQKELNDFKNILARRKDLQIPEKFAAIPSDRISIIGSSTFNFWNGRIMKNVKDAESITGETVQVDMKNVMDPSNHAAHREDKYTVPFFWKILFTEKGHIQGVAKITSPLLPGYQWYKIANNVALTPKSMVHLFSGIIVDLDGVVADNSEAGQLYSVWVSMKITGPDFLASGKPTQDNTFNIDQIVVTCDVKNNEK